MSVRTTVGYGMQLVGYAIHEGASVLGDLGELAAHVPGQIGVVLSQGLHAAEKAAELNVVRTAGELLSQSGTKPDWEKHVVPGVREWADATTEARRASAALDSEFRTQFGRGGPDKHMSAERRELRQTLRSGQRHAREWMRELDHQGRLLDKDAGRLNYTNSPKERAEVIDHISQTRSRIAELKEQFTGQAQGVAQRQQATLERQQEAAAARATQQRGSTQRHAATPHKPPAPEPAAPAQALRPRLQ